MYGLKTKSLPSRNLFRLIISANVDGGGLREGLQEWIRVCCGLRSVWAISLNTEFSTMVDFSRSVVKNFGIWKLTQFLIAYVILASSNRLGYLALACHVTQLINIHDPAIDLGRLTIALLPLNTPPCGENIQTLMSAVRQSYFNARRSPSLLAIREPRTCPADDSTGRVLEHATLRGFLADDTAEVTVYIVNEHFCRKSSKFDSVFAAQIFSATIKESRSDELRCIRCVNSDTPAYKCPLITHDREAVWLSTIVDTSAERMSPVLNLAGTGFKCKHTVRGRATQARQYNSNRYHFIRRASLLLFSQ